MILRRYGQTGRYEIETEQHYTVNGRRYMHRAIEIDDDRVIAQSTDIEVVQRAIYQSEADYLLEGHE